jgi:AraC-like DNA-binding protein
MSLDHRYGASPLGLVVGRFAAFGDNAVALSPLDLIQELRGFAGSFSVAGSVPEQLLARSLVAHLLGRLVRDAQLILYPDIIAAFFALVASPWTGDEWFLAFARLTECCEAILRNPNDLGPGHPPIEVRLNKAQRFIEAHYADPRLGLDHVARHAGLSLAYVARMLKRRTGNGFVDHLRRCRIAAAQKLLEGTTLTIKEIAARVGYGTPRQLERDFKRLCGITPKAFRKTVPPAAPPLL